MEEASIPAEVRVWAMDADYLSAFNLNLRRCQLFGWWKIDSASFSKRFAYAVYRLVSVFWLELFTLLQLLDLFEAAADLEKVSANICGTSVSVASLSKVIMVLNKARLVEDLHMSLQNNLHVAHVGRDEVDKRILSRGSEEIIQFTKIFFVLVVPTILGWSIMPLMDESKEMKLPLRLWMPYDWETSPIYEIFYAYEVVGLWLFAVVTLTHDLIIFGFIIQICSHYEILKKNIRGLDKFCADIPMIEGNKHEKVLIEEINKIIAHHQQILRRIKQLHSIYEECFFIHFGGAVPLICVIGFNIISAGKKTGLSTLMISQIGYVGSALFDIFLFCYFGERLRQQGLKVAEAIYDSIWYKMGPPSRKLLIIIMARAQKSPSLTAGSVVTINLRAFLQTLRNSYNILAVMNQMSR